ncbi:asparagine synthase-related protein [Actinoplanes sp. NPDC049118]|uniref:asparagine synthetase B family protein n=1 Tax=Actinoplanes sp. NPDC049118 TaxID=3155769 RepID=UPI00340A8BFD
MALTGWIHHARDLRDERPTVNAMAAALSPAPLRRDVIRLARHAAFAHRGLDGGYADWRHPERPDPDLAVAIDGRLTGRHHLEQHLYQRPRPLSGDAEVLLHAYRAWGAGLADRIDGSYAIAIWDNKARHLLLIRDPLGAKTLFYTPVDGGLAFASRATALLAHPDVAPVVDADGLNELLTLGPVRTPGRGVIRGVAEVLPGELVCATPAGLRHHRYWRLHADEHREDLDTTVRVVRGALAESTAALRARPAGAVLLSGGVASAAAAVFTAGTSVHRPAAWTLTVAGPDSRPSGTGADVIEAARAAEHLRLRHTVLTVDADALIETAAATRTALDFPGDAGSDAALLVVLRRAAAAGATRVVTGDGADAVFGGYRWLRDPVTVATDDFPWHRHGLAVADLLNPYARLQLLPGGYRKQCYDDAAAGVPHLDGADRLARRDRTMAYLTLTRYLPHLLTRLDQLADAAGLTAHTPFADWLLAHYLFNMPIALRHLVGIPNGLLRHTVADLLPADVAWLRPRPFPTANLLPAWRQHQRERLQAIAANRDAPLHPLLDLRRITDVLAQPQTTAEHISPTTTTYLIEVNEWLASHHITLS